MKQKLNSAKDFVVKHKTAIAVAGTAAAGLALNYRNICVTNEFLKEHDLYDEFWSTEDEEN